MKVFKVVPFNPLYLFLNDPVDYQLAELHVWRFILLKIRVFSVQIRVGLLILASLYDSGKGLLPYFSVFFRMGKKDVLGLLCR